MPVRTPPEYQASGRAPLPRGRLRTRRFAWGRPGLAAPRRPAYIGNMGIKDEVKKRGLQLMSDPRVAKLMQNEQFMRAMMSVIQVPGKVETFTSEQTERFAKMMRLATSDEMKDLKR